MLNQDHPHQSDLQPFILLAYLKDSDGPRFFGQFGMDKRFFMASPVGNYAFTDAGTDGEILRQIIGSHGYLPCLGQNLAFASREKFLVWVKEQQALGWPKFL